MSDLAQQMDNQEPILEVTMTDAHTVDSGMTDKIHSLETDFPPLPSRPTSPTKSSQASVPAPLTQDPSPPQGKQSLFKPTTKVVATAPPAPVSIKDQMAKRGDKETETIIYRSTELRVEFNLCNTSQNINVRSKLISLLDILKGADPQAQILIGADFSNSYVSLPVAQEFISMYNVRVERQPRHSAKVVCFCTLQSKQTISEIKFNPSVLG